MEYDRDGELGTQGLSYPIIRQSVAQLRVLGSPELKLAMFSADVWGGLAQGSSLLWLVIRAWHV